MPLAPTFDVEEAMNLYRLKIPVKEIAERFNVTQTCIVNHARRRGLSRYRIRNMPNPGASEPLTKITINLFTSDLDQFRKRYGHGWSEQIRELVRRNCREYLLYKKRCDELNLRGDSSE